VVKKKTKKLISNNMKLSLSSKSRKISGNLFSKGKTIAVKSGQKIHGKISFKKK
tara:strand:- start:827 stop:988 length:162 start_codon:yes stop_codon:yes gene_type:complete